MNFNNEELRQKFNPDGSIIRQSQLRMLEILKAVDKICKKNNITYWLSCGTMLGAVRHQGFIPWDDDLDIELLRPDYEKLLKILQSELPENLTLQSNETDENYFFLYAKVRDKNSLVKEKTGFDKFWKEQGIWIDIFPVDKMPRWIHKLSNFTFGHAYKVLRKQNSIEKAKRWANLNRKIIFPILKFIGILCCPRFYDFGMGIPYYHKCKLTDYLPVKYVKFEDTEMPIANNPHNYLTDFYGDYMKLPDNPGAKQHNKDTKIW